MSMHPEFMEIYKEIAEFRKDPKELIGMFSEALYEMDKATERYMIEELQDDLKKANDLYDEEEARADKAEAEALQLKAILKKNGIEY